MVRGRSSRGVIAAATVFAVGSTLALPVAGQAQDEGPSGEIFAMDLGRYDLSIAAAEPERAKLEVAAPIAAKAAFHLDPRLFNLAGAAPAAAGPGLALRAAGSCADDGCGDVAARVAVAADKRDWRLSFGASAGLGERLGSTLDGSGDRPDWYVFVAADAQAMSFNFGPHEQSSAVQLDDMRLVGDAQAGVGTRLGGGDLAIGYVTREVSHLGANRQESFVGLTFGWEG
jgi:hypothetical protein